MKNWCQFVFYNNKLSNCLCLLMHRRNYKFICLSAYWQWKLANDHVRISAVIVQNVMDHYENWTIISKPRAFLADRSANKTKETVNSIP